MSHQLLSQLLSTRAKRRVLKRQATRLIKRAVGYVVPPHTDPAVHAVLLLDNDKIVVVARTRMRDHFPLIHEMLEELGEPPAGRIRAAVLVQGLGFGLFLRCRRLSAGGDA